MRGVVILAAAVLVIVACGGGDAVELVRGQLEGRKALHGFELANGRTLEVGMALG